MKEIDGAAASKNNPVTPAITLSDNSFVYLISDPLFALYFMLTIFAEAFSSLTYQPPDAGMLPLQVIHFRLAG